MAGTSARASAKTPGMPPGAGKKRGEAGPRKRTRGAGRLHREAPGLG